VATIKEIREHVATGRPAAVPVGWVSLLLGRIDELEKERIELKDQIIFIESHAYTLTNVIRDIQGGACFLHELNKLEDERKELMREKTEDLIRSTRNRNH